MTNNLRFNLGLIIAVLIFLNCGMMPFLLFDKTEVYKDNTDGLFSYSEVVLTNADRSKTCYIADFFQCDKMLYNGKMYNLVDLDANDKPFFDSMWSKEKNQFRAAPVEFGVLAGTQNEHLFNFVMSSIFVMFLFGVGTTFCYVMPTLFRFIQRDSK